MKVNLTPKLHPLRGGPVEVGNVYSIKGGSGYSIVVSKDGSTYKNVVMLRITQDGKIISGFNDPESYVRDHKDLVGRAEIPDLTIKWNDKNASSDNS